ncbi:Hypothetical protein A7982_04547 [Minicystis rosea]|nr:Hypothetical protein A7982_04547 [Minicystis rosea]
MKVTVVKGKFTVESIGATARVSCNACRKALRVAGDAKSGAAVAAAVPALDVKAPAAAAPRQSVFTEEEEIEARAVLAARLSPPDVKTVATARQQMAKVPKTFERDAKTRIAHLDADVARGVGPMRVMLIAPAVINGRPMGLQPVTCIHCGEVGLLYFESERRVPPHVAPLWLNVDPHTHAKRRIRVSFTVLMAIDHLAQARTVRPGEDVVCPGASLQMVGRKTGGYQDAHQILREVTIGGQFVYELVTRAGLSPTVTKVIYYCHSVVSHLPAKWNKADCLVEHKITADYIELVQGIISGRYRGNLPQAVYQRYIWRLLVIRYYYACVFARITGSDDADVLGALNSYLGWILPFRDMEPPAYASDDLETQCGNLEGLVRDV